jgi:hypothetical protein
MRAIVFPGAPQPGHPYPRRHPLPRRTATGIWKLEESSALTSATRRDPTRGSHGNLGGARSLAAVEHRGRSEMGRESA